MSDLSNVPQKPPFEETELYADMVHDCYHRIAHIDAKTHIKAIFLNRKAPDFVVKRDKLYDDANEAKQDIAIEHNREVEDLRQRYDRGEL